MTPEQTADIAFRLARKRWRDHISGLVSYVPEPHQAKVHQAIDAGAKRLSSVWGRRAGKTILWAIECATELAFEPPGGLPRRLIRITGPEFALTDPVFEYVWHWVIDQNLFGVTPKYARADQRYFELPWGSRIECKTTDNPKALQGKGICLQVCDEHADDREGVLKQFIEPPTFDTNGIVGLIGTPKGLLNHYTKTYETWTEYAATDPRYFTSHATSYDNSHIDHTELDRYRDECTAANCYQLFEQEVLAQFVSLSGSIYDNFKPTLNGVPWHVRTVNYNPDLPIQLFVDWGTIHNFVCLFAQVIDGDRVCVFHEISQPGLDPEQQVNLVLEHLEGRKVGMAYCDPSGAGHRDYPFRDGGVSLDPLTASVESLTVLPHYHHVYLWSAVYAWPRANWPQISIKVQLSPHRHDWASVTLHRAQR